LNFREGFLIFTPDLYDLADHLYFSYHPGLLTKKFIELIKRAEDGILDLNKAADTLEVFFSKMCLLEPFLFLNQSNNYSFFFDGILGPKEEDL